MDQFLFIHRGEWETGVLGLFAAGFIAQRILYSAPLWDSSWRKICNLFLPLAEISVMQQWKLATLLLAKASKPYNEGDFVKACRLKAAEVVRPEKRQAFDDICLMRNTVVGRVGVDWACAVINDRKKTGVVTTFGEKVQTTNGRHVFWTFHCILDQEVLCFTTLKVKSSCRKRANQCWNFNPQNGCRI